MAKKNYSQEEIDAAIAAMEKTKAQRAKQRERMKNDPEAKAKAAERALRLRLKNSLYIKKAKEAGIEVSNKEVDAEIKARQS